MKTKSKLDESFELNFKASTHLQADAFGFMDESELFELSWRIDKMSWKEYEMYQ